MLVIRQIKEKDAEEFLSLCKKIDTETEFMMFEPGERPTTIEEQRDEIKDILSRDNQTVFVAEKDGQLVGYLTAYGGRYKRNRPISLQESPSPLHPRVSDQDFLK